MCTKRSEAAGRLSGTAGSASAPSFAPITQPLVMTFESSVTRRSPLRAIPPRVAEIQAKKRRPFPENQKRDEVQAEASLKLLKYRKPGGREKSILIALLVIPVSVKLSRCMRRWIQFRRVCKNGPSSGRDPGELRRFFAGGLHGLPPPALRLV